MIAPWFEDVTEQVGLEFVHEPGSTGNYLMPQIMGSGAAFFDFDNDGRLDIYLVQNAGPNSQTKNKLFHQRADGRFEDVSAGSGLDIAGYGMGVAIGDINNDGYPDVLLTMYGDTRLFLNKGNGKFKDITKEAGIDNLIWGTSASFFDYDRDGWLDLVIANYVDYDPSMPCIDRRGDRAYCLPSLFPGSVTKVYRNLGRNIGVSGTAVRFEDVTLASGVGRLLGRGLGVVCADFNGDGWPDIFIANDLLPNHLWINQRDGTFREEAVSRGLAYNAMGQVQANMGVAIGDGSQSGLFDIFVTHLAEEYNTYWAQGPQPGLFQDLSGLSGLANPQVRGTGFGTVMADFNNDGNLDLAVVNGAIRRVTSSIEANANRFWHDYAEHNLLFAGNGQRKFRDISNSNEAFCTRPGVCRGLTCGDFDNDGALDLLVTSIGAPARMYRNTAPDRGHWLLVQAIDPALHRDAYGAVVTVCAGGHRWRRWLNPGYSYLCSNDPRVHFGLGGVEHIDSIEVVWPDGNRELFPAPAIDRRVILRKGKSLVEYR